MPTRHVVAVATLLVAVPAAIPQTVPRATATETGSTAVRGWSVDLDRGATRSRGQLVSARRAFSTVGVTWGRGEDPHVEVRTRSGGDWSSWQEVHPFAGAPATEPIWVDTSEAVRVRVSEWRRDLTVVLIDPGDNPEPSADRTAARRSGAVATVTTTLLARSGTRRVERAPMPRLRLREDWGARERWRTSDPVYLDKIKHAHIHHTAGRNRYSRADVPGIIRSMYWYHTKQLGWSDLGYNFLVDRFGRIWVGRAGGFRKRVRGAHTLGFNHASFGVAYIGNTERTRLNERAKGALVRLVAWKLDRDGRAPNARKIRVYSKGSDLIPAGELVRLPAVLSHRRTNQTACPGENLYGFIPRLRERAQNRADSWG
ncbi:MAG TPA: N-acetylmuramoyl-L-alanine amidase [Nocardioidaceae bacterium]|nr:N-acetylmuramoyl-L-alanine amidase [Nocardioidaceae bacterium]